MYKSYICKSLKICLLSEDNNNRDFRYYPKYENHKSENDTPPPSLTLYLHDIPQLFYMKSQI